MPAAPQRPRGQILLVDDDHAIAAALAAVLDEGYAVRAARDGNEALACLRQGASPDLIILDLMMPVIDGWQFRTIQRGDPRLADIPVLAMSADGTFKAKPVDPGELRALVREMVEEASAGPTADRAWSGGRHQSDRRLGRS
jgi:CheY-like chemotaxis protein